MAHHGGTGCIPVVYIRSWSLDVDLVGAFWTLAAGVDEVSPAHDLRRPVQHCVDLFIAQVQKPAKLPERKHGCAHGHKLPPKGIQTEQRFHGLPNRTPG